MALQFQELSVRRPTPSGTAPWPRIAILAALIALETLLIAPQLKHDDFDQYWAGARLALQHRDPYNPIALFRVEQTAGSTAPRVVMLMVPPWTLPLLAPLGLVSNRTARLLWFATSLALLLAAAELLWQTYAVPGLPDWLPLLLALTFPPNISALYDGQILPLIVFSLAAFLRLSRSRHSVLLGMALLGLGIKPHLTYLVTVASAGFLVQTRRWLALAILLTAFTASCLAVAWWTPAAFAGYGAAGTETSLVVSGLGGLLRAYFGMQQYWLQFLPLVPGVLWMVWYRPRLRGWDWPRCLPVLVLASLATSVYGWWFDQSLLMVALVPGFLFWRLTTGWRRRLLLLGYLAAAGMQIATPAFSLTPTFYAGIPLLLAVIYFYAQKKTEDSTTNPEPAGRLLQPPGRLSQNY